MLADAPKGSAPHPGFCASLAGKTIDLATEIATLSLTARLSGPLRVAGKIKRVLTVKASPPAHRRGHQDSLFSHSCYAFKKTKKALNAREEVSGVAGKIWRMFSARGLVQIYYDCGIF